MTLPFKVRDGMVEWPNQCRPATDPERAMWAEIERLREALIWVNALAQGSFDMPREWRDVEKVTGAALEQQP